VRQRISLVDVWIATKHTQEKEDKETV
jgi:hypothetical protein